MSASQCALMVDAAIAQSADIRTLLAAIGKPSTYDNKAHSQQQFQRDNTPYQPRCTALDGGLGCEPCQSLPLTARVRLWERTNELNKKSSEEMRASNAAAVEFPDKPTDFDSDVNAHVAFYDSSRRRIVVCSNRSGNLRAVRDSLLHELVHAFDFCRLERQKHAETVAALGRRGSTSADRPVPGRASTSAPQMRQSTIEQDDRTISGQVATVSTSDNNTAKNSRIASVAAAAPAPAALSEIEQAELVRKFHDCEFRPCTEIRAARLAECRFDPDPRDCVRMSAWRSTRPFCEAPLQAIRHVWKHCYHDLSPLEGSSARIDR